MLAGLEVARCLKANGHRLAHAFEVVNFTCEEPSDFGLSTIGSRAIGGKLDAATAARLRDRQGRSLADAIDSVGGRAAGAVGVSSRRLTSGASHDANHMARLCPIGLIFISCRDGRSPCPEEWAEVEHLETGARVLLEVRLRLDRELA